MSREKKPSLRVVEAFRELAERDLSDLENRLKPVAIARGGILVRQGDAADALYIVVSGRFRVEIEGRNEPIAEIGIGGPIGEIAFFAGTRRTATVTAVRDSLVLRLDRQEFNRLSAETPEIWRTITATLARRLAKANPTAPGRRLARPRTIAVVRAGGQPIPPQFFERLFAAFATDSRPLVVDRAAFGAGGNGLNYDDADATARFNALEGHYHYVVYVTDDVPSAWSEKALRQADLVLLVGVADRQGEPASVPLATVERLARTIHDAAAHRLVLLHQHDGPIEGTRHWLAERAVHMHHHIRLQRATDYHRLVRFIAGQARGLIASGGGAFAAAHVGLYQALGEAGVVFDMMGGASGGGAMTAAFATGTPPREIDDGIDRIFVRSRSFRRLTYPRYGVLDHKVFDRELRAVYGEVRIEDMPLPFFCVSTNLSAGELYVHRQGKLWEAVRASGSIPGLLPPMFTADGRMLVDGSLIDNVPVKTMRELKAGPNVVLSFETTGEERFAVDYDKLPSRGALLLRLALPFGRAELPQVPSPGTVLARSLMARGQAFEMHLGDDDISIRMPYPADMSVMDWGRHTELMERSYEFGRTELARLASTGRLDGLVDGDASGPPATTAPRVVP